MRESSEQLQEVVQDDDQLLTDEQVGMRYGVSRNTVWRWVEKGLIPKPVKIGVRTRWRKSEIIAHIRGLERSEKLEAAS